MSSHREGPGNKSGRSSVGCSNRTAIAKAAQSIVHGNIPGSSCGPSNAMRGYGATRLSPPTFSASSGQLGGGSSINVSRPSFGSGCFETGQVLLSPLPQQYLQQQPLPPFNNQVLREDHVDQSLAMQHQQPPEHEQPDQFQASYVCDSG